MNTRDHVLYVKEKVLYLNPFGASPGEVKCRSVTRPQRLAVFHHRPPPTVMAPHVGYLFASWLSRSFRGGGGVPAGNSLQHP
uniref:Uncharacterized protein n=1 Tax=Knipowitschia caucasica TaxID=637954 RepID=A0AAV2K210_KNICA